MCVSSCGSVGTSCPVFSVKPPRELQRPLDSYPPSSNYPLSWFLCSMFPPGGLPLAAEGSTDEEGLFFLTEVLLRLGRRESDPPSGEGNSQKDEELSSLCEASVTTQLLRPELTGNSNLLVVLTLDPADTCLWSSIPVLRLGSSLSGCLRRLSVNRIPTER